MCGIAGYISLKRHELNPEKIIHSFTDTLRKRGPDTSGYYIDNNVILAHTRLSIIDISEKASQPMYSQDKSVVVVFNGEIFNFRQLRNELEKKGYSFYSESDTEVILYLYIEYGLEFASKLNGFFAIAIHDKNTNSIYIVRDRFGIKPVVYYQDESKLIFASEMKAILAVMDELELDFTSLQMYFRLTYIPPPYSVFKNVNKLEPGHILCIQDGKITKKSYYSVRDEVDLTKFTKYEEAKSEISRRLEEAVKRQLVSDVPLGCFLSGGIDSSVVTALAARHVGQLQTFSIGFRDEPYYDETRFAEMVARKHGTKHTAFSLTTDDLFNSVFEMLDYIDEPFADSSGLAVFLLSHETRKHVTVALSGDGADELFGGYNKYLAEFNTRNGASIKNRLLRHSKFLLEILPKSRGNKITDIFRKLHRYSTSLTLSPAERYWFLSTFIPEKIADNLMKYRNLSELMNAKQGFTKNITAQKDISDFMLADVEMVLTGDMLPKVDYMSMAQSLEVRPPFLDNEVVTFAFSIPSEFKMNSTSNKRILRDTFGYLLPDEVLNRNKHGFEVPMNRWFRKELRTTIENDLLADSFVEAQGIFDVNLIRRIKSTVMSGKKHDFQALVWSLIVFQHWYKQYSSKIKINEFD